MKYQGSHYIKDDVNGQFGGKERQITIDGKTYQIDLQDKTFNKLFEKVLTRGRLVKK